MNYVGDDSDNDFFVVVGGGGMPGDYPSGGPASNVFDIWMKFSPNLDFIAPDALFIPKQRRDDNGARRIWIAFGIHAAIEVLPFGIHTLGPKATPINRHYGLTKSVSATVLEAQRHANSSVGFCLDEIDPAPTAKDPSTVVRRTWGGFELTIERCSVFEKPGTGAGMAIHRGGVKFLLIGWGFQVRSKSTAAEDAFTGILKFEDKTVEDAEIGKLRTARMLNGSETLRGLFAMMPNEDPDYGGFPIWLKIPARTMIAEVEFCSVSD